MLWTIASAQSGVGLPELWPPAINAPAPAELEQRCATLNNGAVPAELKSAVRFEQTFLKILASTSARESKSYPPSMAPEWGGELRGFVAADRPEDVIAHGVAEVARAWIARADMLKIEAELHQYYRHHVRFPSQFSEIESALPEPLRRDPWGAPWAYKSSAPSGMAKLSGQRYTLGPALYPTLGSLKESVGNRAPLKLEGTLTKQSIGGKPALEIQSTTGSSIIQPGGKTGIFTLLYLGDNWALFASPDQLFAIPFSHG